MSIVDGLLNKREKIISRVIIMKRVFDIFLATFLLILFSPFFIFIPILIRLDSPGSVFFTQQRIGKNNCIFTIFKFRTMAINTPNLPTHLIESKGYITATGKWLRKSSLDEIPQLMNILLGHMSFVGPRPALYNQEGLITDRTKRGIHSLVPGLTGWAQVNGRDEISDYQKADFDEYYLKHRSLRFDFKILLITISSVIRARGVSG
ncbi:sugar transferase [Paenibacillus sp. G2S3]|uniref:sugar transferase n=1 Tax=Paenibacillus sp. G2S3 TaxID=3047872 RepID=UPI0032E4FEA5